MVDRFLSSYDEFPYSCHPVHLSHPDNLACKALLHGLRAPAVDSCRVLEIGCGTGGNLLPLAQFMPRATFVGIDNARRQILQGRAIADTVGISNVDLKAIGVAEVDDSLGEFDYIICHGVYSWVSPENQNQILRVIQQHLAPTGVAFVSYNIYPGWHLRGLVREILCRQVKGVGDPATHVQQARKYLEFLIKFTPDQQGVYAQALRREDLIMRSTPDSYVFHEHLEELNQPVYFHEFVTKAAEHRLQFLSEARFHSDEAGFSDELKQHLASLARDRIEYEQQIDFLCNGTFRRTLLCHTAVPLTTQPTPMALKHVRLSTRAAPSKAITDFLSASAEEFRGPEGEMITTSHPLLKAALVCLSEARPRSLTLDELLEQTNVMLSASPDPIQSLRDSELLANALLRCHKTDLVEIHLFESAVALQAGERPRAAPLVRWQAAHQEPVGNSRHRMVDLGDLDRLVLSLLDGTRDRRELCRAIVERIAQGQLSLEHQGKPIDDPELIEQVVEASLPTSLDKLAGLMLLAE